MKSRRSGILKPGTLDLSCKANLCSDAWTVLWATPESTLLQMNALQSTHQPASTDNVRNQGNEEWHCRLASARPKGATVNRTVIIVYA